MNTGSDQLIIPTQEDWSRRRLLKTTGAGIAGVGLASFLAACTGGSPSKQTDTSAGPPKRGGTLRFGCQGGGSTDTLDAHLPLTNTDNARMAMLYDQLVRFDSKGRLENVLAEEITPNANATEWTIKIRSGVVTHTGKSFEAKDVLFTIRRIFKVKGAAAASLGPVDLENSHVIDKTTVLVKFKAPYSPLREGLTNYAAGMVPEGYDPKKPDGTGPFKFKSFTPGTSSTFVRNENYWQEGLPYLDAIVTTNVNDETAQLNGLRTNQLDVINFLSASSVAVLKAADFKTIISETGGFGPFTMRVDKAPFKDVRVRQALRLVIDREQMLKQVFGGYGTIGNDVFGITDPLYPKFPQRKQDITQAKSLLKAAGQSDLRLQLITTDNAPGMVNAATVFASQAKRAGVSVQVKRQNPTDYFASSYLKVPFTQDYNPTNAYLIGVGQWTNGKEAPYNPTFFDDPKYLALYKEAIATVDQSKQKQLIHDLGKIDYDTGGNMIPYFFPTIEATVANLHGVEKSVTGLSPGGFDFKNFWFSS